ncbi:hypothetical protein DFP73DRAFT_614755 [Morchella snyderi]|nr:hypothetical protein DFP73DRAFT_532549 [Morchella snyderi]KAI5850210.1 hypothetical protein DFP73DRAFT_614755 [Morchella snyderi]
MDYHSLWAVDVDALAVVCLLGVAMAPSLAYNPGCYWRFLGAGKKLLGFADSCAVRFGSTLHWEVVGLQLVWRAFRGGQVGCVCATLLELGFGGWDRLAGQGAGAVRHLMYIICLFDGLDPGCRGRVRPMSGRDGMHTPNY